jgi:hypothetical protein
MRSSASVNRMPSPLPVFLFLNKVNMSRVRHVAFLHSWNHFLSQFAMNAPSRLASFFCIYVPFHFLCPFIVHSNQSRCLQPKDLVNKPRYVLKLPHFVQHKDSSEATRTCLSAGPHCYAWGSDWHLASALISFFSRVVLPLLTLNKEQI